MLRNRSHASICEEIPTSLTSGALSPVVRLVNMVVVPHDLNMSISRVTIDFTSRREPADAKFVIGSMTTTFGRKDTVRSCIVTRCFSSPNVPGRAA